MKIIFTLLRKDCANFLRDKAAVSLTFLVPIALIYIFGQVFGINRKDSGPRGIQFAVVNQSSDPAAQKLVDALSAEKAFRVMTTHTAAGQPQRPLTEDDVRGLMRENQVRFGLVIPQDVIRKDAIGVRLKILSNPRNEIEAQTVNGLVQKAIFASVPELLGRSLMERGKQFVGEAQFNRFTDNLATTVTDSFGGDREAMRRRIESGDFALAPLRGLSEPGTQANASTNTPGPAPASTSPLGNIVKVETEQVIGKSVKNPEATRVVGGWAMMFLLFAVSASASAFFDEKKTGIFQRLLAAPVRRAHILWSRFLFGTLLGLVQLTALFFAGRVMYGVDVLGNFWNLVVICVAAGAASTALGMLIVSLTSTSAAAQGLSTFVVLTMSACGGAWFPISFMPEFMQKIAKFTIVYWAMEGFSQVLWAGQSFVEILPTVGVLAGIAVGVMAIAVWRFDRGRLFE
jgi:ABC-2 type transport system permease protein